MHSKGTFAAVNPLTANFVRSNQNFTLMRDKIDEKSGRFTAR